MKDPRLIVGLLFLVGGISAAIFAITYDPAVGTSASNASSDTADHGEIPPGTVLGEKCAQPGVVNCFGFENSNSLHYTWPPGPPCDSVFRGQKKYNFGNDRQGLGNSVAVVQNDQCVFPEIDKTTFHSGTGSLEITIPSNSYADSGGHFTEVFKRNRDGSPAGVYIGPGSPFGNVLYFQFYQKFDGEFLSTDFKCLDGDCGGWKQAIWFGNPPNANSASSLEVTLVNGWQRGVPQMYGQIGADYYGVQDIRGCVYNRGTNDMGSGFMSHSNYPEPRCIQYKANRWMEFTGRIEIRGESNQPASHVQLWVDGELAIDYDKAKIDWSGASGNGFGQFLLSPYHTKKDGSQVHPVGHVWYDDLVISTQPIRMGDSPAVSGKNADQSRFNNPS
jgi:hypothetical protein